MLNGQRVIFLDRMQVDLEAYDFDDAAPTATEILMRTEFSAISSGTELALLSNNQDIGHWQGEPYPAHKSKVCPKGTGYSRRADMHNITGSTRVRRQW